MGCEDRPKAHDFFFIVPIVYEEDIKPYTASIESQFVVEEVVAEFLI